MQRTLLVGLAMFALALGGAAIGLDGLAGEAEAARMVVVDIG